MEFDNCPPEIQSKLLVPKVTVSTKVLPLRGEEIQTMCEDTHTWLTSEMQMTLYRDTSRTKDKGTFLSSLPANFHSY